MNERDRFEEWARHQGWTLNRCFGSGAYLVVFIQRQWEAWQFAKAEAAKERESLQAERDHYKDMIDDVMAVTELIADALGVKSEPHQTATDRLIEKARTMVAEVERLRKRERDAEELIRTLAGIANSVDVSAERKMWPVDGDDPAYWQTEQWCEWVKQQEEQAASWLFAYQPERKGSVKPNAYHGLPDDHCKPEKKEEEG